MLGLPAQEISKDMEQWDVIFTSLLLKTLDSVLLCNPIPLP